MSIWTSFVLSRHFLVGIVLSPRFLLLLRLVWHNIRILIRTYPDLLFFCRGIQFVSVLVCSNLSLFVFLLG